MKSVIDEIICLRENKGGTMYDNYSNRYSVVMNEKDGSKTSYYFSSPIYNMSTHEIVELKFNNNNGDFYFSGSNAFINISDDIYIENEQWRCKLSIDTRNKSVSDKAIMIENGVLYPTVNGIICKFNMNERECISFELETDHPPMFAQNNGKYFALMEYKFTPSLTVSCIGCVDSDGNIIAPAEIMYEIINDRKFRITIIPCFPKAQYLLFEINAYEKKLFYDTTVESMNPDVNNVFGGIAFIGTNKYCGEQWLYSKPDISKLSGLFNANINRLVMHIPKLDKSCISLSAYKVSERFCSFGSNWSNKVPEDKFISYSRNSNCYYSIDITDYFVSQDSRKLACNEGLIIRADNTYGNFTVLSTSDSSFAPQIFEINYN